MTLKKFKDDVMHTVVVVIAHQDLKSSCFQRFACKDKISNPTEIPYERTSVQTMVVRRYVIIGGRDLRKFCK